MAEDKKSQIRIQRLSIKNYKGIDSLDVDFPAPRMSDDPDIFVMGSENGLGKTSVLECCSLLLLTLVLGERKIQHNFFYMKEFLDIDLSDWLVKSGEKHSDIEGEIYLGKDFFKVKILIFKPGLVKIEIKIINRKLTSEGLRKLIDKKKLFNGDVKYDENELMPIIFGLTSNSFIATPLLLFHSYRKIQEGNPDLGAMVRGDLMMKKSGVRRYRHLSPDYTVISIFKMVILRSLMSGAKLFELEDKQDSVGAITTLNNLIKEYAGGMIGKLRPSADNTLDFRIQHDDQDDKNTFSFDGLSSGQKEIISTLFLIWYQTRNSPSVVFIDEPELHLNAQWHSKFIKNLTKIAPANQYIIATHSEYVMDSVDRQQRVQLEKN